MENETPPIGRASSVTSWRSARWSQQSSLSLATLDDTFTHTLTPDCIEKDDEDSFRATAALVMMSNSTIKDMWESERITPLLSRGDSVQPARGKRQHDELGDDALMTNLSLIPTAVLVPNVTASINTVPAVKSSGISNGGSLMRATNGWRSMPEGGRDPRHRKAVAAVLERTTTATLQDLMHLPLFDAARYFNVSSSTFKKLRRKHCISKWPYRRVHALLMEHTCEVRHSHIRDIEEQIQQTRWGSSSASGVYTSGAKNADGSTMSTFDEWRQQFAAINESLLKGLSMDEAAPTVSQPQTYMAHSPTQVHPHCNLTDLASTGDPQLDQWGTAKTSRGRQYTLEHAAAPVELKFDAESTPVPRAVVTQSQTPSQDTARSGQSRRFFTAIENGGTMEGRAPSPWNMNEVV